MKNIFNLLIILSAFTNTYSFADAFTESTENDFGAVEFTWSPLQANRNSLDKEVPLIFIDPSCSACKQMIPFLKQYPSNSYQVVLVIQAIPTAKSLNDLLWHLSSGAGLKAETQGCQSDCSSLETLGKEPEEYSADEFEQLRRMTRAVINTKKWKDIGGVLAATPSAYVNGQYRQITSPEELNDLLGNI